MKPECPKCQSKLNIVRDGRFWQKSTSKHIQRYKCNGCSKRFSAASFSNAVHQNQRRLNPTVYNLLVSGVSMRRIALLLSCSRLTVKRKLIFLASLAKEEHFKWLAENKDSFSRIQFDDLETLEHTKCKPLSVTCLVAENRKILDFCVSRIPAKGLLAKIARKKYGFRPNDAPKNRHALFKKATEYLPQYSVFSSDCHKHYPYLISKYFPKGRHIGHPGKRGCVTGQGELKKVGFDPLFNINHTFAMFRANVNRLFRRSWNTTKDPQRLEDHLWLYVQFHNSVLVK